MAQASATSTPKRYALVTGANKGIGFEVCRQLASSGIFVLLTARDEKRGLEAVQKLKDCGISDDLLGFHQLDVVDPHSVASLAEFVKAQYGKLDILVNYFTSLLLYNLKFRHRYGARLVTRKSAYSA
ncbi:unnamed protein product [Cuscuta europaea]|uniref:(+)-neomenthol dehydrogenase-like n=1 Tax=Cuscuta europaea TaxID=41803 RepID=A0A9P0ZMS5_CUSEU|nr:unnamed protein product [Cuscuta europaea]